MQQHHTVTLINWTLTLKFTVTINEKKKYFDALTVGTTTFSDGKQLYSRTGKTQRINFQCALAYPSCTLWIIQPFALALTPTVTLEIPFCQTCKMAMLIVHESIFFLLCLKNNLPIHVGLHRQWSSDVGATPQRGNARDDYSPTIWGLQIMWRDLGSSLWSYRQNLHV